MTLPSASALGFVPNSFVVTASRQVSSAAIGAIAGAVLVLGKRTLVDLPTILIALTTITILMRFKKLPEPLIIAAAALTGIILKLLIQI